MLPAPLVVIHGGPGVPSNYLMNLVNVVTDRTVIFYDQLGCGRSSRPLEKEAYSIQSSVDDLRALLDHWKLKNYHLFGHSFGGIIAFEFLKYKITSKTNDACKDSNVATTATTTSTATTITTTTSTSSSSLDDFHNTACLSVILSSVPTETKLVQSESERLLHLIREQGCDVDQIAATFSQTHECRVIPTPLALLDAYAQAGSSVWRGISAIPTYKATLETNLSTSNDSEQPMQELLNIACCILWGQYDFVTEPCVVGWNKLFANVQSTLLAGCSHHGLLENEQLYGDVIVAFLEDHDLWRFVTWGSKPVPVIISVTRFIIFQLCKECFFNQEF